MEGEDDVIVTGQTGSFSSEYPHPRAHCTKHPFMVVKDRVGCDKSDGNEAFCENCFCFVCDSKASDCQGWLTVGHCHASDKDPYWKALREFTRSDMLCNSPLLRALGCDEAAQMEAHRSCVNGLLAFHRYRDGDPAGGGIVNHSFQHVTDVASGAMKAIVGPLCGPKGPRTTLAVLDGITSAIVTNSWRPGPTAENSKHRWCKGTFTAYKSIIEQLEKYWVLAIVHTSTRSVPPQALTVMAARLKLLSNYAQKEVSGRSPPQGHIPLTHAISACERGWTHPVVVAILEGQCSDLTQREAQTLQRARLHVLERAQRHKEAYHYAIFHGHVAKSLAYMVRAGRHADVLPMILRQSAMAGGAKCVPVCAELAACNQSDAAIRLGIYCAFGDYEKDLAPEQIVQNRMPYVQWLIEHVVQQLDPSELQARNQYGSVSGAVESARRDAEEWARQVVEHLAQQMTQPLAEAPLGSAYTPTTCRVERVAALCAVALPVLAPASAQLFAKLGDYCGAASVVLIAATKPDTGALVGWALQELLPKLGMDAFQACLQQLQPEQLPIAGQMGVASAYMMTGNTQEAIRWATNANLVGAPSSDELPYAHFEKTRNYRACELQQYIQAAHDAGNAQGALLLAELQMWWEPSWAHLQALSPLCSPQKYGLRRQQLQSLVLNDNLCPTDRRFEVLVREGMYQQGMGMVSSLAHENQAAAHAALRGGLELLGAEVLTQQGVLDTLWPLCERLAGLGEGGDAAMEVLAPLWPQKVIAHYDQKVDTWQRHCLQSAVTNATKANMRSWLTRAKRIYEAAGQHDQWERRFNNLASALRRKTSLNAVFADIMMPGTPNSTGRVSVTNSTVASPRPPSMPSTPSMPMN